MSDETKSVKVYNLTDVETPALKQAKLLRQTIAVGRTLVRPGEAVDVLKEVLLTRDAKHFLAVGALAQEKVPAAYRVAQDQKNKGGK